MLIEFGIFITKENKMKNSIIILVTLFIISCGSSNHTFFEDFGTNKLFFDNCKNINDSIEVFHNELEYKIDEDEYCLLFRGINYNLTLDRQETYQVEYKSVFGTKAFLLVKETTGRIYFVFDSYTCYSNLPY
jgi:hypothetical protein